MFFLSLFPDEKTIAKTVTDAFSAMADLMKAGSKNILGLSDSKTPDERTIVDTSDDLISLEYLTISEERPSSAKAMRLATLQFNTLNCIGMCYAVRKIS